MLELLCLKELMPDPVLVLQYLEEYEMVFRTVKMFDKSISEFITTRTVLQEGHGTAWTVVWIVRHGLLSSIAS